MATKEPEIEYEYQTRTRTTIRDEYAPSVRMVVLSSWTTGKLACHSLIPVVALRRQTKVWYFLSQPKGKVYSWDSSMSAAELLEAGWQVEAVEDETTALVLLDDEIADYRLLFVETRTRRLLTCPWPPSEDEERLEGEVAACEAEAIQLLAEAKARYAEADEIKRRTKSEAEVAQSSEQAAS